MASSGSPIRHRPRTCRVFRCASSQNIWIVRSCAIANFSARSMSRGERSAHPACRSGWQGAALAFGSGLAALRTEGNLPRFPSVTSLLPHTSLPATGRRAGPVRGPLAPRHRASGKKRDGAVADCPDVPRPRGAESSARARPVPDRRSTACHADGSTPTSVHAARPNLRRGRVWWRSADRCPRPAIPWPQAMLPTACPRVGRSRYSRRSRAKS